MLFFPHVLLLPYRCKFWTSSPLKEDRRTPKRGSSLFCQVINCKDINHTLISQTMHRIYSTVQKYQVSTFKSTLRDSTAFTTTLYGFIKCQTPWRPNQLVVCPGSGRALANLIKSLWAGAEESTEEILCSTSCAAEALRVLFLSLSGQHGAECIPLHTADERAHLRCPWKPIHQY